MVMTRLGWMSVAFLIAAWPAGAAPVGSQRADLVVAGQGATSEGEPTTLGCELNLVAAPSNVFVGRCVVEVGTDRLVLGGLANDDTEQITVVLDGHVVVRARAVNNASGRFHELLQSSRSGFPVYVEVDPLGRSWAVRGHGGDGGGVRTVARGRMTDGAVHFRMP